MLVLFYDTIMKDVTFDGIQHAEEIFFKSKFSEEETKDIIKKKLAIPYGYYDNSDSSDRLLYTKKRLFVCNYNLHCDIQVTDDRYRLKIYYSKSSISWLYYLSIFLFVLFIGCSKILAKGDDTLNMIIFFGLILLVGFSVYRIFDANPSVELRDACRNIKKELDATIKLELEP